MSETRSVNFRSLEPSQIEEIHRRQNAECAFEISDLIGGEPFWAPMSLEAVKKKIVESEENPRTSYFSIWTTETEDFIGMGMWSASWDPQSPRVWLIIWPEYRRKGYGTVVAKTLLQRTYMDSIGHTISTGAPEWDQAALGFIKSLGFRGAGRMRRTGIRDGQYFDSIMFDMVRQEYIDQTKEVGQ